VTHGSRVGWRAWIAFMVVVALAVVFRVGGATAAGGAAIGGQPLSLTFKDGLAYENGVPIMVGIAPDFSAGVVGLDVQVGGEGVAGGSYPTPAQPVFGPDAGGFSVGDGRAGPQGEIDLTLTSSTVASMRVKGVGAFKPVRVLGLLAGEEAFVFYRRPGSLGTVLGPGVNPDVLQSFEKAKHEPALTETLYNAAGGLIPVHFTRGFHLASSYWKAPAAPAANARCAVTPALAGVTGQWGEVATDIAPDRNVTGTAFLSCLEAWYRWHGNGFQVGILLNAEAPGSLPAALWNATALPRHPGIVEVKPVQQAYKIKPLPTRLPASVIVAVSKREGKAAAAQQEARWQRTARAFNERHAGRTTWRVYAPGALARRVGAAWLVVRDGSSLAQRLEFLDGLRVTRLDVGHTG
jgi:hypothetical protein